MIEGEDFVALIDNYDSFTWNVYQFLCDAGANVKVFRNDEISIEELRGLKPARIVISPGPGHPRNAGISCDVIRTFAGKIPIFGVCLGEQAIYECFGGRVTHAGEIMHGKTSEVEHNGQGVFKGIPQGVKVTRYHSLAGDPATLPDCLEVTCKTANGIIMAIRHKEFTIEGVQFHPESILSEHGIKMFENFMGYSSGRWDSEGQKEKKPSILERIVKQRFLDVNISMETPGQHFDQLMFYVKQGLAPKPIDVYSKLRDNSRLHVLAEIKRASPSKGIFDINANPAEIALKYANGGASVISVLTEPHWFKGHLLDMQIARKAVDHLNTKRPAILRKDFIVTTYQIAEARIQGADLVLLIVACIIDQVQLKQLIQFTEELGMQALVEVNNEEEMMTALNASSKIVGVNNRNLNTFDVDMSTTTRLADLVHEWNKKHQSETPVLLIALSGVQTVDHARYFKQAGASGILVGETLMKSNDPGSLIQSFQI